DITRFLDGRPVSDLPDPPRLTLGPRHEPLSNENSLAVLPLKLLDLSQTDSGPDFLGTGLADALITRWRGGLNFAVRPTRSVLRFAKRGTNSAQAHEAYLRGRFYWNTFTEDGFARAIVCYQQAIALDSNYALAHAGVAAYHNWLGVFSVMPFAECAAAAYEAASIAVEI